jgi:hypothetical protein
VLATSSIQIHTGCSSKKLLKKAKLPHKGKIRFIPKRTDIRNCQLSRSQNGGYIDKFGNIWVKPSGIIMGKFHWDVQMAKNKRGKWGWLMNSDEHMNVTQDGKVPH